MRFGPQRHQTRARSRRRDFERLYREHFGLLWSVVRNMGIDDEHREDVLQEVWLRVYRRLHTLDPGASTKAWLCAIARNVVLHHHRSGYRRRRKLASLAAQPTSPPQDPQVRHAARDTVTKILDTMDQEQRHVLVLAQVHGLSGPEIAKGLGIPLNTAYSRLRLARQHVRSLAAAEAELVAREQPPADERRKSWALLVPHLAGSGSVVASAGLWATAKFWVPAAGLTIAGMGLVATATPDPPRAQASRVPVAHSSAHLDPAPPSSEHTTLAIAVAEVSSATTAAAEPSAPHVDRPKKKQHRTPAADRRFQGATAKPEPPRETSAALETSAATEPTRSAPALAAEADLLRRAQKALADGDPAAALELLGRHQREFPNGQLRQAREGALVRALCQAGRGAEARARALALRAREPSSTVAEAVSDVCAPKKKSIGHDGSMTPRE